jgi:hypothetical protein
VQITNRTGTARSGGRYKRPKLAQRRHFGKQLKPQADVAAGTTEVLVA